jgi:hypothetical protein
MMQADQGSAAHRDGEGSGEYGVSYNDKEGGAATSCGCSGQLVVEVVDYGKGKLVFSYCSSQK